MNYAETIEYIHSTPKFSRELGNDLLSKLLKKMNNPQKNLKFIHIAGTNGKGSCAIMLSEILMRCGYKTGLFTSPYIEVFNERIKINGEMIDDTSLADITSKIKNIIEEHNTPVSEFALDTAIAFDYFNQNNCDIVVLETGLGGRLDATNVIDKSVVSILTSIDMDHMQYLGTTLSEIAGEKCGIIKDNGTVVVYPLQSKDVKAVIKNVCKEKKAKLIYAKTPVISSNADFILDNKKYTLSLKGDFQKYNASTVICAINELSKKGFKITDKAIQEGLLAAFNPARFETLPCGLILDGAHNASAMRELCNNLKKYERPVTMCLAMMQDKNIFACINELKELMPNVIATQIDMPRCEKATSLASKLKKAGISVKVVKDAVKAAKLALNQSSPNGIAVVCGSLYLVGQIRKEFINVKPPPLYYVYIIRCYDNSLYTGITTDVERRFREHKARIGAKYTSSRAAVSVEAYWEAGNRSYASKLETFIKTQPKETKEDFIKNPPLLLEKFNKKNP